MTDHTEQPTRRDRQLSLRERAETAFQHDRRARRERHLQAAAGDITALQDKLAELGVEPIPAWLDDQLFQVEDQGTVVALIVGCEPGVELFGRRRVWACARSGRLWLRATTDKGRHISDAGELDSLADIGRAIVEGPSTRAVREPLTNAELANQIVGSADPAMVATDAYAICQALDGLTYAVLAVVDEIRDSDLPAIGESIERYIGGVR